MKNKQIKMPKLQLSTRKQEEVEASKEAERVIGEMVNNCPIITSVVGMPLMFDLFKKLAEEEKDVQTVGERSTLLSRYFRDIATMIIDGFVQSNQIKFRQMIIHLYNQYLPELVESFIKNDDDYNEANPEMIVSFGRILLCEMFTFANTCYDSYTHQLNRHPRENIDIHDLQCSNNLYSMISYTSDRIYDIKYYLLHSNNFMELSLTMVTKYTVNISNSLQSALCRIKIANLSKDEIVALDAAWTIISNIFGKYSIELLAIINDVLNSLMFIANEIDSGNNIVNYLPRQILAKTSTMPIDFDIYRDMEKKAKKNHINKSVGFVVEETANMMTSAQKILNDVEDDM